MRPRLSIRSSGAILVLLAVVSWAVVAGEALLLHQVSLLSIACAALVTSLVLAWPFLNGTRLQGGSVIHLHACHLCGSFPVPGLKFCIRCGAYPKPLAA